jgi:hypothetical protein
MVGIGGVVKWKGTSAMDKLIGASPRNRSTSTSITHHPKIYPMFITLKLLEDQSEEIACVNLC